jgi:hypothetical protein
MGQSLIGGATSYEEQSLTDILDDVKKWVEYTLDSKSKILEYKNQFQDAYWYKIPWNFQLTITSTLMFLDTILFDLGLIKAALLANNVTSKEVALLRNIGRNATKKNIEYGKTFKEDNCYWHDYKDAQFKIAEKIYCEGRDYFVTLMDADNAAHRLEDYMNHSSATNNTLNVIGDIAGSQIQQGTAYSSQFMITEECFDYKLVLEALEKIQNTFETPDFLKDLGSNTEKMKLCVEEAMRMAKQQEKPSKMKAALSTIRDLAVGVSGGIIANAIFGIITQLHIV